MVYFTCLADSAYLNSWLIPLLGYQHQEWQILESITAATTCSNFHSFPKSDWICRYQSYFGSQSIVFCPYFSSMWSFASRLHTFQFQWTTAQNHLPQVSKLSQCWARQQVWSLSSVKLRHLRRVRLTAGQITIFPWERPRVIASEPNPSILEPLSWAVAIECSWEADQVGQMTECGESRMGWMTELVSWTAKEHLYPWETSCSSQASLWCQVTLVFGPWSRNRFSSQSILCPRIALSHRC